MLRNNNQLTSCIRCNYNYYTIYQSKSQVFYYFFLKYYILRRVLIILNGRKSNLATNGRYLYLGFKPIITPKPQHIHRHSHSEILIINVLLLCKLLQFINNGIVWNDRAFQLVHSFLNDRRQHHTHLIESVLLTCYKCIELVETHTANQLMTDLLLVNSSLHLIFCDLWAIASTRKQAQSSSVRS